MQLPDDELYVAFNKRGCNKHVEWQAEISVDLRLPLAFKIARLLGQPIERTSQPEQANTNSTCTAPTRSPKPTK
jgi:hypothetical protein